MTPLSRALRRLQVSAGPPTRPAARHATADATRELRSPPPAVVVAPAAAADQSEPPAADAPLANGLDGCPTGGLLHLYADLTGGPVFAGGGWAAVRATGGVLDDASSLIVIIRPGAAPTGPTLHHARESAGDNHPFARLAWPVPGEPRTAPDLSATPTAVLPIGSAGIDRRRWVLFLDACRNRHRVTSLTMPAACGRELAWLAPRCDTFWLAVEAGRTAAEAARRTTLRLAALGPARPRCLIVRERSEGPLRSSQRRATPQKAA